MNTFSLLSKRRLAPLFWVQFSSAMNNNIFKSGLMVLIAFQNLSLHNLSAAELINLAAGLFILPFFLFSTIAGFIADKYEKSKLIQNLKLLEVLIMLLAVFAFYFNSLPFLLLILFLLGVQATLFGPLKYSILPQHLDKTELIAGNALIEMGTFMAILIGTVLGSIMIYIPHFGIFLTLSILLGSALISYGVSFYIPIASANEPSLHFNYRDINMWTTIKTITQNKSVWIAVMALSWFWLYGAFVLTQLPSYTKLIMGGNPPVFTLFLVLFSVGIGLGSLLCSRLSKGKIRLSLVITGAIGMSLFTTGLFFASPVQATEPLLSLMQFLAQAHSFFIIFCLLGLSISAGFYTVPLFAILQQYSLTSSRSRVMAANNILNAIFMVLAAILGIFLLKLNFTIPDMLLLLGILNLVFNTWIGCKMLEIRL